MCKSVLVTTSWDDGDRKDLRLLKLMNKYGIKGTFYIPGTSKLKKNEIRDIAKSQEIGAHTMTHSELEGIPRSQIVAEVQKSKKWLEGILGKEIIAFCYPRGRYDETAKAAVGEAGFKYARTTERFMFTTPKDFLESGTSCQTITFKADIFKFLHCIGWNPIGLKYMYDWNYFAERMFMTAQERGGIFHLWGHSYEIERFNQWSALEQFFSFLATQEKVRFVTNGELVKRECYNECSG